MLHEFNVEFETETPDAAYFGVRFADLLARDDVFVVLAEGDDATATGFGYLTLRPTPYADGPLAQLEELYVVPTLRDRGIGTRIIQAAVAEARRRGAVEMHINVDEVDTDTRRFYERHGFTNISPGFDYRMLCYLQEF